MQAQVQLTGRQVEQLMSIRATLLHEMGLLIAERDRMWAELQVCIPLAALTSSAQAIHVPREMWDHPPSSGLLLASFSRQLHGLLLHCVRWGRSGTGAELELGGVCRALGTWRSGLRER